MEQSKADLLKLKFLGGDYFDYRSFTMRNPSLQLRLRDISTTGHDAIERIHFHTSDEDGWTPDHLSKFFVTERNFSICSYHYYITADKIYHMVDESVVTPNAAPYNQTSVAFAIDYHASKWTPLNIAPQEILISRAIKLAAYLSLRWNVSPTHIFGHREIPNTGWFFDQSGHKQLRKECPGLLINLDDWRKQVNTQIQSELNSQLGISLAVDGIWGQKSADAFHQFQS